MPMPARETPAGSSQSAPRASDQRPKAGWMMDELIVAPRMRAPTIVYERSNLISRKGRSAGSDPCARSVARWPEERAAMPRGSTSSFTRRTLPGRPRGNACGTDALTTMKPS